eukprot:Seg3669.2 transcript_id=Seg3669.2/GoldUCD/mRNA.D3Y31 product="hypothetical protein" protein_id=Seg3669.2/GoldUCD/D3Y31
MSSIFHRFYDEGASLVHSVKNAAQESLRPWSAASALQQMGLAQDDNRIIAACNEFWSVMQQGSTNSQQQVSAMKDYLITTFQSTDMYSDVSQWLLTMADNFPSLPNIQEEADPETMADGNAPDNFSNFEDYSDVIKDFIKSMKVLVTFEAKNDVQDDIVVPHFNAHQIIEEQQRNPARRFVGRI